MHFPEEIPSNFIYDGQGTEGYTYKPETHVNTNHDGFFRTLSYQYFLVVWHMELDDESIKKFHTLKYFDGSRQQVKTSIKPVIGLAECVQLHPATLVFKGLKTIDANAKLCLYPYDGEYFSSAERINARPFHGLKETPPPVTRIIIEPIAGHVTWRYVHV